MSAFRIITGLRRLALNNTNKNVKILNVYCQKKFLSSKIQIVSENNETEKKKKTTPIPRITVISPDENIQVLTLEEAQKLSTRRNLKLVKLIDMDTKTQRPVYKLMTGHEYLAGDLRQRVNKKNEKKSDNSFKSEKLLLITSRISEHDLESRIKKISKWLEKRHEVRITITGDSENMEPCETLYKAIEEKLKGESRILQKRNKGNELKFQIVPPKIIPNTRAYSHKADKNTMFEAPL